MKQEKRASVLNDISLISFIVAAFFLITSFFWQRNLCLSATFAFLAIMKFTDAAKDFSCDNNKARGKKSCITAIVFLAAAIVVIFIK